MIHADPNNPKAQRLLERISRRLEGRDALLDDDLCVVIGGDGWMLHTLHDMGEDWTYLGVNAGRVGFLLNDIEEASPGAADQPVNSLVDCLLQRTYWVNAFPLLRAKVWPADGGPAVAATAINDVYVERTSGAM
ncbi:MAG: hypothetical protein GXP62_06710, partial [Oligoflexia bacterium]|nr:hypothetical protein [Oligoflexia bacterium]